MAILGPFDFSKGFSSGFSYYNVPQGYSTKMQNCRFTSGSIALRWSQKQTNSAALGGGTNYVTGLTTWIDAASSVTSVVAITNAKIYTADATSYAPSSSALTFTDRTGATTISSSNTLRYTFDSLNGILIIAGNSAAGGLPLKLTAYNSNAANLGGSPPKADCVKVVNNFAFLGRQLNSTNTYSTINWSNVSDPETWGAANSLEVNKKDGEQIMALGAIGSDLYILKQTSIWRLSTVTQTISGAVTLGPLQLVIKGVGCVGPLALDNLPNGDIVFVGGDGHFYEFDGSSVFDLSLQAYPGPNAFSLGEFSSLGLSFASINSQICVKTWRGIGEVWIGYDSTVTGFTSGKVYAYDYLNHIWQGFITDSSPKCFTTMPIALATAGIFESTDILFHGNATGSIFARGDITKPYPIDESATPVEFYIETTLRLASESSDFTPRSFYLETDLSGSNLNAFSISIQFDSNPQVATVIYSKAGPLPQRVVANIPIKQDSVGSNILPTFMAVWFRGTGTGSPGSEILRLGRFYVGDEVIR